MTDHSLLLEEPPRGWIPASLDDICRRVQDAATPSADGLRLYLGLEHLASGHPTLVGRGKESDVRSGKTTFRKGDVLFGKLRPYLRKSVLVRECGICSTDILVFRATEKCIPQFLCLLTHTDEFVGHAKTTTSGVQHPRTSWAGLREFKLYVPPLPEQRKITAVLGLVQRAIAQQERLIALTTELKKTLLHQLFTQGLRGEPQKQTEIGPVPESWEVVELGQISHKPEYGFTESAKSSGNTQFLRITDIQEDGVQWDSVPFCECPDDLIEKYLLSDNDILFARIGATTGKNFLVKKPPVAVFASYLIRIRLKNVISADFISQFCDTPTYWRQIDTNKGNNLKGGINSSTLKRLLVPVPADRKEQDEIAEIFRQINMKAAYVRRKHSALSDLFRTLLHQLMTAQIRVHNLDLPNLEIKQ